MKLISVHSEFNHIIRLFFDNKNVTTNRLKNRQQGMYVLVVVANPGFLNNQYSTWVRAILWRKGYRKIICLILGWFEKDFNEK